MSVCDFLITGAPEYTRTRGFVPNMFWQIHSPYSMKGGILCPLIRFIPGMFSELPVRLNMNKQYDFLHNRINSIRLF